MDHSMSMYTGDVGMVGINSSSGQLYVNKVIDREHPSLTRTDGIIQLIVQVSVSQRHKLMASYSSLYKYLCLTDRN